MATITVVGFLGEDAQGMVLNRLGSEVVVFRLVGSFSYSRAGAELRRNRTRQPIVLQSLRLVGVKFLEVPEAAAPVDEWQIPRG